LLGIVIPPNGLNLDVSLLLWVDIGVNIRIFHGQLVPLTHGNSIRLTNALPKAANRVTLGTNALDAFLGSFIK